MLRLKHAREASRFVAKFERGLACLLLSWLCACAAGRSLDAQGDEQVVILPREIEELDPRFVGDAYGLKLSRLLFASLVTIDPFTLMPRPDLAERIEHVDALHYRVELRAGLRFSDGSALDAQDVVATFRGLLDAKVNSRYRSSYARLKSVQALGPRTVSFELSERHSTFITDLEMPVLRSQDAYSPRRAQQRMPGAGPYVLQQRSRSGLTLTANPFYAGPPVRSPKLRFVVVRDDNVRALRMLAGAGDLAQNVLPPLLLPLFVQHPELKVLRAAGTGTTYLGLNLTHQRLQDVRVRAALAHAIDREQLVRYKLAGHARLASSWIPPGHWAHDSSTPSYPHQPERARQLLAAAGHGPEQPLSLVLRTSSDRSVVSLARAIAGMLRQVGVRVEVRPSESATLLSDLARGRFELTLMQLPELFEPHVLSWFFSSDRIPEPGQREGGNRFRLRNPELDALLEQGRREPNLDARKALYARAQHILARELPVIPLWHEDVVAVVSPRMGAYQVPRDARFGTLAR